MEFRTIHTSLFTALMGFFLFFDCNAQHAQEKFGKNKIQYNTDQKDWWIYETTNFVYYWYGKGRNFSHFLINMAEEENQNVLNLFEYHPKEKIELVIFSDLSDLQQTNIDLSHTWTPSLWNLDPKIKGQKILIYFNGNHEHAVKMLRKGLVQVYFNSMFSGTNFQEVIQKVISYKLPPWFETGLIEYLGEGWTERDQRVLDGLWKKRNKFKTFSKKNPVLAGKSFWNYVFIKYGDKTLSNWLYLIRIQKDLNQATRMVFQIELKELMEEWRMWYKRQLDELSLEKLEVKKIRLKKEESILDASYSKVYQSWVMVTDQNNRKRIRLYDNNLKFNKTIYRSGHRNKINIPDHNYPIYVENDLEKISIVVNEEKNRIQLNITDHLKGTVEKTYLPDDIFAVYDLVIMDRNQLIFSGSNNGFSDLFIYKLKSRSYQKLTDDIFDETDLQLAEENGVRQLYFLSNRLDNIQGKAKLDSILPIESSSIFKMDVQNPTDVRRVENPLPGSTIESFTRMQNEYYFLKGIHSEGSMHYYSEKNRKYDLSHPLLERISSAPNIPYALSIYKNVKSRYQAEVSTLEEKKKNAIELNLGEPLLLEDSLNATMQDTISIIPKEKFQSAFGDPPNVLEIIQNGFKPKNIAYKSISEGIQKRKIKNYKLEHVFNPNQSIAYRDRFQIEETSANLNNDLLFGGLNTFAGFNQNFAPPNLGLLFKIRVRDIFENYHVEGGLRIPTSLSGSEAYLLFENDKKRFDHIYAIYRKSSHEQIPVTNFQSYKQTTNTVLLNYQLLYALDPYKSIRLNNTLRNDHLFLRGTDLVSLDSTGSHVQSLGMRLEFVFDDVLDLGINLKQGSQVKIFFETMKRFRLEKKENWNFRADNGLLHIAGFDARHHIPVLRHSVFSNRLYFSSSFGGLRMLNHLGGTENWLIPQYGTEGGTGSILNYTFSQQVTEVRGFPIGARRGSSAMVFSSELRIPFFHYILNQSWRNSFLRNLQLIGFLDAGMAWNGFLPNLSKAEIVEQTLENPAVIVDIKYRRNPIISATGIGVRSALFGYFIRADYGWPFDISGVGKPIFHLSLGLDF